MSVEVQFFGGPADGRVSVIDGDPMDPPDHVELMQAPEIDWTAQAPVQMVKLRYLREVSPSDDGPLWRYRYEDTA